MGFAAMAGGLAGGVTVMVLKYVVPDAQWPAMWFGVANVIATALVMLRYVGLNTRMYGLDANIFCSSIVLWVSQNMEDDYTYNLAL